MPKYLKKKGVGMFSRSVNVLTEKEEYYYKREQRRDYKKSSRGEQRDTPGCSILDSSLIFQTNLQKYSIKIVECGEFKSVYFYEKEKFTRKGVTRFDDCDLEKLMTRNRIDRLFDEVGECRSKTPQYKKIEEKNIQRTKIEMQRLVKSNISEFKTFTTLTFDQNKTDIDINDISEANKIFNIWKTYIKRKKPNFKYICVPEFQKRGAIHYHLISNIDYNDYELLSQEERKIWNKKEKKWQVGRDIIGWKYGINMTKNLDGINVVGYLTKYMTKDIDNRLFGKRRYFASHNLKKPKEVYITNQYEFALFMNSLNDSKEVYSNIYLDKFGDTVQFREYVSENKLT